jgi:hypothetical protein
MKTFLEEKPTIVDEHINALYPIYSYYCNITDLKAIVNNVDIYQRLYEIMKFLRTTYMFISSHNTINRLIDATDISIYPENIQILIKYFGNLGLDR